MLLTLTTTHVPATDLGYLLHKNPAAVRRVELPFGRAHVVYPEASAERCTAALLVDVDPVGLVRDRGATGDGFALRQYVNDRPYAANSLLSVALAKLFGTAMAGRCDDRPELVARPLPLEVRLPVISCRDGEDFLRSLFEPLGYRVDATAVPLDPAFAEWGPSRYFDLRLSTTAVLADVLSQLYVLIPVLDDDKHYWVADDEIAKLLRRGGDWLAAHPARDAISLRYLRHQRALADAAVEGLLDGEVVPDDDAQPETHAEVPLRLSEVRLAAVAAELAASGARRVLDLGCGDGRLLAALAADARYHEIVGVDVSHRALQGAARRLHLDTLPDRQRQRIRLLQGSLTYRDRRLAGYDAAALVEVVEHLDPGRLDALADAVFAAAAPATVVVTTPNLEHNARFPGLAAGGLRHADHRFEWTRAELAGWAADVAGRHGYTVRLAPVGPEDPDVGAPTQMAVFSRVGRAG